MAVSREEKELWAAECQREKLARRAAEHAPPATSPAVAPPVVKAEAAAAPKMSTMTRDEMARIVADNEAEVEEQKGAALAALEAELRIEPDPTKRRELRKAIEDEQDRLAAEEARRLLLQQADERAAAEEAATRAALYDAEAAAWCEAKLAALKAWAESIEHAAAARLLFDKYRGEETKSRRAAASQRMQPGASRPFVNPRPSDAQLEEIEARIQWASSHGKPEGASKGLLVALGVK